MAFASTGGTGLQGDNTGRVYTLAPERKRIAVLMMALQPVAVAVYAAYVVVALHRPWFPLAAWVALSAIASLLVIGEILTSATVLYRDRIETRTFYTRRTLQKADIATRSLSSTPRGGKLIELTPKLSNLKPMKVPQREGDLAFNSWFRDIPVREPRLTPRQTARLAPVDPIFAEDGVDPALRRTQVRMVARAVSILSVVAFGWLWFTHEPNIPAIATVILLPLIAMAAVFWSNGLIALTISKGDPRPHMIAPLFAGLALTGAPLAMSNYGDAPWLLIAEFAIGLVLFGGIWRLDARSRKNRLGFAGIAALCLLYGKFSFEIVNQIADTGPVLASSAPLATSPTVIGTGSQRRIEIVANWPGSRGGHFDIVTPATYSRIVRGNQVCLGVHPGALGLRWAEVRRCG